MRIHEQNKMLKKQVEVLLDGLTGINHYLNSQKFDIDNNVNKNDILLRMQEIKNSYHDVG